MAISPVPCPARAARQSPLPFEAVTAPRVGRHPRWSSHPAPSYTENHPKNQTLCLRALRKRSLNHKRLRVTATSPGSPPKEPFPGGTQPDPPVTRTFGWAIGELKAKTRLKHGAWAAVRGKDVSELSRLVDRARKWSRTYSIPNTCSVLSVSPASFCSYLGLIKMFLCIWGCFSNHKHCQHFALPNFSLKFADALASQKSHSDILGWCFCTRSSTLGSYRNPEPAQQQHSFTGLFSCSPGRY